MSEQATVQTQPAFKPTITPITGGLLQRQCACGQHTGNGGECDVCKKQRKGTLQRAAVDSSPINEVPSIVHEVLRSPGQQLDAETRAFLEPRFGHDFSHVQVHTDAKAAESARAVNALAYTVSNHIAFGGGQYRPQSNEGKRLLAHELTHVLQQQPIIGAHELFIKDMPIHEAEAEQAADWARPGSTISMRESINPSLQRNKAGASSGVEQIQGAVFLLPNVGGGYEVEKELLRRGILKTGDYDGWGFLANGYYFSQSSGSGSAFRMYRVVDALYIKNENGDTTGYRVISYLHGSGQGNTPNQNPKAPPSAKAAVTPKAIGKPKTLKPVASQPTAPSPQTALPSNKSNHEMLTELKTLPESIKILLGGESSFKPENLEQLLRIANKLKQLQPEDLAQYKLLAQKLAADLDAFERSVDFFVQFKEQIKAQADAEKTKQATDKEPTLEEKLSKTWSHFDENKFSGMDVGQKEALARDIAAQQRNIQLEHMTTHPGETALGMAEGIVRVDKAAKAIAEDVKDAADGNKGAYTRLSGAVGAYNKYLAATASIVFIALLFVPGVDLIELAAAGLAVASATIVLSVTESELRIKAAGEAKTAEDFKTETAKSAAAQANAVVAAAMLALTLAMKIIARIPLPGRYQNVGAALKAAQTALLEESGIGPTWQAVKTELLGKLRTSKQGLPEALTEQFKGISETAKIVEGMSGDEFVKQLAAGDPKLVDLGISSDQAKAIQQISGTPEGKSVPGRLRQDSLKALQDAPVEAGKKVDQFLKNVDDSIGKVEKAQNQEQLKSAVDDANRRLSGEEQARQATKDEQAFLKKRLQTVSGETQLDARIAEAEAELNPARQKTLDYQALRAAEGKNLKGGPIKGIWNIKERIWLLKRQKAFPSRTILEQPEIVGVKATDGTMKPTSTIAGKGRTPDFVEVRGSKTVAGDLKSASEIKQSIAGGIKKPGPIEAEFRDSSKIGQQHQAEAKILEEAQKQGGKIVIKGKNVLTGEIETMEVDPANYSSEAITYEDVLPN